VASGSATSGLVTSGPVMSRGRAPARGALRVVRGGARLAAGCLAAALAWLLLWATVPRVLGWHPTLVIGGSMAPSINRGDIVVVRPVGPSGLGVGAVVTFADPGRGGQLVTHRIVQVLDGDRYRTRGDHNHDPDPQPVPRSAIRGRAVLRLPYLGRPVLWARDRSWTPLGVLATAIGIVFALLPAPASPRRPGRRDGSVRPPVALDLHET
jgi:signal peptidase